MPAWLLAYVADAGGKWAVAVGASVTLDGSGSHDPNPGDVLTYSWQQVGEPKVTVREGFCIYLLLIERPLPMMPK